MNRQPKGSGFRGTIQRSQRRGATLGNLLNLLFGLVLRSPLHGRLPLGNLRY